MGKRDWNYISIWFGLVATLLKMDTQLSHDEGWRQKQKNRAKNLSRLPATHTNGNSLESLVFCVLVNDAFFRWVIQYQVDTKIKLVHLLTSMSLELMHDIK